MAAETNQAIVCRYCGRSITHPRQLLLHEGRCAQTVNGMLGANAKHGTLGEHHDVVHEALRKTSRWKLWTDNNYHELMLIFMIVELILLGWIAWKK